MNIPGHAYHTPTTKKRDKALLAEAFWEDPKRLIDAFIGDLKRERENPVYEKTIYQRVVDEYAAFTRKNFPNIRLTGRNWERLCKLARKSVSEQRRMRLNYKYTTKRLSKQWAFWRQPSVVEQAAKVLDDSYNHAKVPMGG